MPTGARVPAPRAVRRTYDSLATIARQSTGATLLSAFDPTSPVVKSGGKKARGNSGSDRNNQE